MPRKVKNHAFLRNYSYYVPSVADIFILIAWLLVGALLGNLISLAFSIVGGQALMNEYSTIISYPLMFLPAMLYAALKSRSNSMTSSGLLLDSNNFGSMGAWLCGAFVVIGTLSLGFCADALSSILPPMPVWLEEMMKNLTQGKFWINFITVSIFAPLFEEWLCRGIVLRGLLGRGTKPIWAIVISSLFFAIIHLNPWQAIPAFLLGIFFGYVYYKTGSLKMTMLMHFTNNTFALAIGQIEELKDMQGWADVFPTPLFIVILLSCLIITALIIMRFSKLTCTQKWGSIDKVPGLFE